MLANISKEFEYFPIAPVSDLDLLIFLRVDIASLYFSGFRLIDYQFEYSNMVEMLILRAKLELLNSRLQEAQHLLHEALAITQEKGLKFLQKKIEQEQQQLEQDFASWTELVENNAPMQDRIHRAQLDQYIKDALKYSQKED